jgi:hypothetical protein
MHRPRSCPILLRAIPGIFWRLGMRTSSALAFRLLKMICLRDEGRHQPSVFFVLNFVQLLARLRIFLD